MKKKNITSPHPNNATLSLSPQTLYTKKPSCYTESMCIVLMVASGGPQVASKEMIHHNEVITCEERCQICSTQHIIPWCQMQYLHIEVTQEIFVGWMNGNLLNTDNSEEMSLPIWVQKLIFNTAPSHGRCLGRCGWRNNLIGGELAHGITKRKSHPS